MIRLTASLVLLVTLLAATTTAGSKTKDRILGKWESQDGTSKGVVVEYKNDGTTTATFKGKTLSTGKYKFVEDDVMEFESTLFGSDKKLVTRYRVKITDDELTQINFKTKAEKKLKRVK